MGYAVACLAKESAEILQTWVDHYVAHGAEQIFLYFDGSADHLDLKLPPHAELISCDDAFWSSDGRTGRPSEIVPTQRLIFTEAYRRVQSDWLLACDADELVYGDGMIESLQTIPNHVEYVRVPPVEAVWSPGHDLNTPFSSPIFRAPTRRYFGKLVSSLLYGDKAKVFPRGIISHHMGKSFFRRGVIEAGIGPHFPLDKTADDGVWWSDVVRGPRVRVFHYDAISMARWKVKLAGRIDGSRRSKMTLPWQEAMLKMYAAYSQEGREEELFRDLYVLSGTQQRFLKTFGLLVEKPF